MKIAPVALALSLLASCAMTDTGGYYDRRLAAGVALVDAMPVCRTSPQRYTLASAADCRKIGGVIVK